MISVFVAKILVEPKNLCMLLVVLCGFDAWPVSQRVEVFDDSLLREYVDLREWKLLEGGEN